jgi:hypothetical protein
MNFDIDHIDPKWKEGQDYQLVCGLDVPQNFCEREERENKSKSNRFLPWRVAQDELGSVPLNSGDLCQFLDPDTNEWVLMEFLGDWWFEETWETCGPYFGLKNARENNPDLSKQTFERILRDNPNHQKEAFAKLLEKNPNHQSEAGSKGGKKLHEEKDESGKSVRAQQLGRMGCKKKKGKAAKERYEQGVGIAAMTSQERSEHSSRTQKQRYMDPAHPELGVHSAPTLALVQKSKGYPHQKENRVRVK